MSLETAPLVFYKPTRKIAPLAGLNFLLLMAFGLPVLAYSYAAVTIHARAVIGNFFEIINPFCALLFGFVIAWLADTLVVRRGRVRSPRIGLLVGIGTALWAYYLHWWFWVEMVCPAEPPSSWLDWLQVGELYSRIREINESGTWVTFFRSDVPMPTTGWALSMLWFAELVFIVSYSPYRCFFNAANPFCENLHRWYEVIKLPELCCDEAPLDQLARMETDPESVISDMKLADPSTVWRLRMTLFHLGTEKPFLSLHWCSKTAAGVQNQVFVNCVQISHQLKQAIIDFDNRPAHPEPCD